MNTLIPYQSKTLRTPDGYVTVEQALADSFGRKETYHILGEGYIFEGKLIDAVKEVTEQLPARSQFLYDQRLATLLQNKSLLEW